MIPTLFFVALITFALAKAAPGSPFDKNPDKPPKQEIVDRWIKFYGLDKPVHEQFIIYMGNVLHLDFGTSIRRQRAVTEILGQGFPVTAQLGIQALILALAVALPLGVISALKQNTMIDYGSLFFATVGTTIPSFVMAIFFIYIFALGLNLFPITGWRTPHPRVDARGHSPGLRAHRAEQGPSRAGRHRRSRPQERDDPRRDRRRTR